MQLNLSFPLAVVCHDAGAANIVISWLRKMPSLNNVQAYMSGPAFDIWTKMFPDLPICSSLDQALLNSVTLVSGTGWSSDVEYNALRIAKKLGIHTVAVLDHWVNYRERFSRDNIEVLPDEFWVTDDFANNIACTLFPGAVIRKVPNYYFAQQLQQVSQPECATELLYITEPARSDWGKGIPGEFQALDYFLSQLKKLELPPNVVFRLRPHPSDKKGKYSEWLKSHPQIPWTLDESPDMCTALSRVSWVVGCESFALVLALAAGRRVYCSLPPWAPACRLPHDGLIHLKTIE